MKKIVKKSLPVGTLRSLLNSEGSINEENRTVELTWSTGSKGLRSGWDGSYYEELSMESEHVDMTRLQSGAPLLDAHNGYSNSAVIGVVERAWIQNGEGKAVVRFSSDPDADRIFQKVKEKVLRNVSVGYQVRQYTDVSEKGDAVRTYRATNWQPHEISIVPIGFDPNAQIRSQEQSFEVEIETQENNEEEISSQNISTDEENKMTEAEKRELELASKKQAVLEEKERQANIRMAVRSAKLEESFADELINADLTFEQASKRVFEKQAAAQPEPPKPAALNIEVGISEKEKIRTAIEDSLIHRLDRPAFDAKTQSRDFLGMPVVRLAEMLIDGRRGMNDAQIIQRAMSTSDLPLILANVAEKSAARQYQTAKKTFDPWTSKGDLRNYKQHSQVKLGDFSSLEKRNEKGEFKYGKMGEEQEVAQLEDFGKILKLTKQMMINDDLQVLSNIISRAGSAGARLESKAVYDVLLSNPNMADGVALFHANHGNLAASGTVINDAAMAAAFKAMREQKTVDKEDNLELSPAFLIVGPSKENEARKFLSAILANQTSNVNIYSSSLQLIVENRITGNQWFVSASPSEVDTVTLFKLTGQEQPVISTRENWSDSSMEFKVEHTIDAAPMDYRGLYKNPGA